MTTVSIVVTDGFGAARPVPLKASSLADCVGHLLRTTREERFYEHSCPAGPTFLRGRIETILSKLSSRHVELSREEEAELHSDATVLNGQWSRWSSLRLFDRAARLGRAASGCGGSGPLRSRLPEDGMRGWVGPQSCRRPFGWVRRRG